MLICTLITGDCLLDAPESTMPLPQELPGITYSLDQQCQQTFGEEFLHCPSTSDSDICSQLWCKEDGMLQCSTKNGSFPWADGTPCSPNRTCLQGVCELIEERMQPLVRQCFFWCFLITHQTDIFAKTIFNIFFVGVPIKDRIPHKLIQLQFRGM